MRKMLILIAMLTLMEPTYSAMKPMTNKPTKNMFYVFKDRGNRDNSFIPSGWMGSFKSLKINPGIIVEPGNPTNTCLKITYSKGDEDTRWAGIYWQIPINNWGDKRGGYDLSNYNKLTFKARGEKGGEYIGKFCMGGISAKTEEGDSDGEEIDNIELTKDWKEYTIPLVSRDLTHIIGGFCWAADLDSNPDGMVFYLDDIKYSK